MAVRQYVGARYVPKFADPLAWQSGTSYEALTIVQYNNSSYTSKIPVPANVGNPADNPTYWALTGNYNAQVEAYREATVAVQESLNETEQNLANEIEARENADNTINHRLNPNNRIVVIIGDSYGDPSTPVGNVTKVYPKYIPEALGLTEGSTFFNYCLHSTGWVGVTGNPTWYERVQSFYNAHTDIANSVTDIVFLGGANDLGANQTTVVTNMTNAMNFIKTNFPIAKVYAGVCGMAFRDSTFLSKYQSLVEVTKIMCNTLNWKYMQGFEYILHYNDRLNADMVHPTQRGEYLIAACLVSYLNGGDFSHSLEGSGIILNGYSGSGVCFTSENHIYLNIIGGVHGYTQDITMNNEFFTICTIEANPLFGNYGSLNGIVNGEAVIRTANNNFKTYPAQFQFLREAYDGENRTINLQMKLFQATDGQYDTITNVVDILPRITAVLPFTEF